MPTQFKQKLYEVDFRAVSIAIFLSFFILCNVDTYMPTQLKQKLYEVDFRAVSTAIVLGFCTLSNVWFLVFEAFCECGQKFNESKSYLRSSLGLI